MNTNVTQIIGLDVGRGYTKAYSEFLGVKKECKFKSCVGIGRTMDYSNFKDPIFLEVNGEKYFAGLLAEVEGDSPTQNLRDDKTTLTVHKLIFAALNKVAATEKINIMLGVPNKLFRKSIMEEIKKTYVNKHLEIKDKINGTTKKCYIENINIFREADAALLWAVRNKKQNENNIGMVNIGFRTTELSLYDPDLKYLDKYSSTIEVGNKTALEYVQRELKNENIIKTIGEIDSKARKYKQYKEVAFNSLHERLLQDIENAWINLSEIDLYIAGGTALNLPFDSKYKIIDDAQLATAKGLYLVGTKTFK